MTAAQLTRFPLSIRIYGAMATLGGALAILVSEAKAGTVWGPAGILGAILVAVALASFVRLPRPRLVIELAVLMVITAFAVGPLAPPVGLFLLLSLFSAIQVVTRAPEAGVLRLNAIDRYCTIHEYDNVRLNTHHFVDAREPFDQDALAYAVDALLHEIPIARSFVRESFFSVERFYAKTPWVEGRDLVDWTEDADEERELEALERPIDLQRAPPFRLRHAPRREGGFRLTLTVHHSAFDGSAGFLFLERLLQRYEERRSGKGAPEPFAPTPLVGPRYRELLRRRGLAWTWSMIRRHVRPNDKVGVKNASLVEDENALPARTRHRLVTIPIARWEKLKERAQEKGQTPNTLLFAAALRAADAWRRARSLEDKTFRVLLPNDLRPLFRLERGFQNYVGVVAALFEPAEIRSEELPKLVAQRVLMGFAIERAVETPVNLGVLGGLLPPWLFRSELAKWDKAPANFFYSFIWSNIPTPRLTLPASVERVWVRGSLTRQPGFGAIVTTDEKQVTIALEYLTPATSEKAVADFAERFEKELAAFEAA